MLTDEEESGSTTSSCDEIINLAQEHTRNLMDKKDDYDSSATVSDLTLNSVSAIFETKATYHTSTTNTRMSKPLKAICFVGEC